MNVAERILEFIRREAYKPLFAEELAQHMDIQETERAQFDEALNVLEANASIIKTRFDKYGVPERMNLFVGRFEASARGFGFVISDDKTLDDDFA